MIRRAGAAALAVTAIASTAAPQVRNQFYMALNKACAEAVFVSLPQAGHGPWNAFLTSDGVREAATIRSTAAAGCAVTNPMPCTPAWKTIVEFLDRYMTR